MKRDISNRGPTAHLELCPQWPFGKHLPNRQQAGERAAVIGWVGPSMTFEEWAIFVSCNISKVAMRGSGGVPLQDVTEECRRSIDLIAHVTNQDGWRHVTEIRMSHGFADGA